MAQSMGGIIAVQAALQKPHLVRGLVLAATSGGMDMRYFAAADWRTDYRVEMPQLPQWFADAPPQDFSPDFGRIHQKTLLIWGGKDTISPSAAGKFLQHSLPDARLVIVPEGGHDASFSHAGGRLNNLLRHWQANEHERHPMSPFPSFQRQADADIHVKLSTILIHSDINCQADFCLRGKTQRT